MTPDPSQYLTILGPKGGEAPAGTVVATDTALGSTPIATMGLVPFMVHLDSEGAKEVQFIAWAWRKGDG
jgi:hypothetical protein